MEQVTFDGWGELLLRFFSLPFVFSRLTMACLDVISLHSFCLIFTEILESVS
jgi:hypothetical protein